MSSVACLAITYFSKSWKESQKTHYAHKPPSPWKSSRFWGNVEKYGRSRQAMDGSVQGGSNMTGTDLCVNKPHSAAVVRPWESEATTSTLPPARVRGVRWRLTCASKCQLWLKKKNHSRSYLNHLVTRRMFIACSITKATDARSECVAFPRQMLTRTRLNVMFIRALLVLPYFIQDYM